MASESRTVAASETSGKALTVPRLPIERYRGIAAVIIILMLLVAALAPLGVSGASAGATLQTFTFDATAGELANTQLFNYVAESQRQQVVPPQHQAVLRETSLTPYARLAIAGEMMIQSEGPDAKNSLAGTPHALRDAALGGGPARWDNLETFYSTAASDPWAVNGLGAIYELRASSATGAEQIKLQDDAIQAFGAATLNGSDSNTWSYIFNWGLGEMLRGNYQQAALLLDRARRLQTLPQISFYLALAELRLGEADRAIALWTSMNANPDPDWSRAVSEALADALMARGDGGQAVNGYMLIQNTVDTIDWGLYEKVERIQMLRGADSLLDSLNQFASRFSDEPRVHYDLARALMALGRYGNAESELRRAIALRPDEPQFYVGLAQLDLAAGKNSDAVTQAETALKKLNLDPATPDLSLVYVRLTNADRYQQSFAQAILDAQLARATAWGRMNQTDKAKTLADAVIAQGGSDPAQAAWYRYYGGLLYAASGQTSFAQQIYADAVQAPAASGPSRGAWALAWVRSLATSDLASGADAVVKALGGQTGQPALAADASEAYAYYELAQKLENANRATDAAPLYRIAAAWEAGQRNTLGQPTLSANDLVSPVQLAAGEADFLLRHGQYQLAAARYQQILNVEPSAANAHTNRGIALYKLGNSDLARREFELATHLDSGNTLAQHDLGVLALSAGPADILTGLNAIGAARVAGGPDALALGNDLLQAPQSVGLPAPVVPADQWFRIPAVLALLLLLLHTLIFNRRAANEDSENPNTPGVLGSFGATLAARVPAFGLRAALLVAILIGGIAWGLAGSGFSGGVWAWLGFIILGLIAAAVALGAHTAAQTLALRREKQPGTLATKIWPLGLLLSIVGAPFGLVYGWTLVNQASGGAASVPAPAEPAATTSARRTITPTPRNQRSSQPVNNTAANAAATSEDRLPWRSWGALGPAARVAVAGLLANLLLAIVFGLLYNFFGHPLWRMLFLVNVAVLAFTAVSEPQAEGWQLWRRSPLAWLLLFLIATTTLTLLLLRVV